MELDRLKITGPIDNNTPICVIIEIANTKLIDVEIEKLNTPYINNLIKEINRKPIIKINNIDNINQIESMLVKTFVNPTQDWRKSNLIKAAKHMITFYENVDIDSNFEVGNKTEANIYAYNGCMLYKLCRYYQINVNRDTTKNEMESAIKRLLKGDEIRESILDVINNMSNIELINLSLTKQFNEKIKINYKINNIVEEKKSFCNINPKSITTESLKKSHIILQDPRLTTKRIIPQSQEEVIILSAMIFFTNISESINPHKEFLMLKENKNNYIPVDSNFRKNYIKNPNWYNIKERWDIKFDCIYNSDMMNNFLQNECIEGSVLNEIEEHNSEFFINKLSRNRAIKLLTDSRLSRTFYIGIYPHMEQEITSLYMEKINGYNKELLITYGSITENKIDIYTIEELIKIFNTNKQFVINNENLSEQSINKLTKICLKYNNTKIPNQINNLYTELYNVIQTIKSYNKLLNENVKSLIKIFNTESEEKEQFIDIFKETINIGMAMRGWNGIDEYPLTQKQTELTEEYNITGIKLTLEATKKFWIKYNNLSNNVKEIYNNLKQYAIINKSNYERTFINGDRISIKGIEFETMKSPNSGLTIINRIKLIEDDVDLVDNTEKCIRTSSNWICGGIYYYLLLLDQQLPYNSKQFVYIQ